MTRSQADTLESAARAAMVAEYYQPLASARPQPRWPIALPVFAGIAGIVAAIALVLLR